MASAIYSFLSAKTNIVRQLYAERSLEFGEVYHRYDVLAVSPRPRQDARSILWLAASPKSID